MNLYIDDRVMEEYNINRSEINTLTQDELIVALKHYMKAKNNDENRIDKFMIENKLSENQILLALDWYFRK